MIDGSKMSKSLGNAITVKELLQKHTPDHFRMLCMAESFKGGTFYWSLSPFLSVSIGEVVRVLCLDLFCRRSPLLRACVRVCMLVSCD